MGTICLYGYFRKIQQLNEYIRGEAESFKSSNEERFKSILKGLLRAGTDGLV